MKIFSHRQNNWKPRNELGLYGAEVDIQVCDDGQLRTKHEPAFDINNIELSIILEYSGYEHFFVDIKQNLDVKWLKLIHKTLGDKLFGLFDIPFPSAYFAAKENMPIYARLSEFEPTSYLFDKYWVDPLDSQTKHIHSTLITSTEAHHNLIIACPSLHGHTLAECLIVWDILINLQNHQYKRWGNIDGIVTKFPQEASKLLLNI